MNDITNKFHNGGVWFVGRSHSTICSTEPRSQDKPSLTDVKYYGGHCLAESMYPHDAVLASFAPDMWELLVEMHKDFGGGLPSVEKILCDIWIAQNTEKFR